MRLRIALGLLFLTSSVGLGFTQEAVSPAKKPSEQKPDPSAQQLDAIRAESKAFVDAFNKADAAAIASLWTADGEYVDDAGATFVGRDPIEKAYADYFRDNPNAKIQIRIDSLRMMSSTAAIEEGSSLVEVPPAAAAIGRYLAVHVKVDGKWHMASVRDVLVATAAARQNVADLGWLIGTWVAEEHGSKYESVCRWVSDQSFVQRDFTITRFDGTKSSGVQLIGWNPQAGHVQSWTFSPDGGHAIGAWAPTEGGWAAQMQGTTGDGISTMSTNLLRRLDDNAYVWQSVNRTVDGVAVSDTDEIVLKRLSVTQ